MADAPDYGVSYSDALADAPQSYRPHPEWDGIYRFPLDDGSILELPETPADLTDALFGIYLVSGMGGVEFAYRKARASVLQFETPDAVEIAHRQKTGGYGPREDHDLAYLAFRDQKLAQNPGMASAEDLEAARIRNRTFLKRLLEASNMLLRAEETAQRWYEDRLIEAIIADLEHQRLLLTRTWAEYDIGPAGSEAPISIESAQSAEGLALRTTADLVEVDSFSRDPNGKIQGGAIGKVTVPAVLKALHDVGVLYFEFRGALQARSGSSTSASLSRDGLLTPYRQFRDALAQQGERHFIVYAAYRKVASVKKDLAFRPRHCERLVIEALLRAYREIPGAIERAQADRLFTDADAYSQPGEDDFGRRASDLAIERKYGSNVVDSQGEGGTLLRSPWLQRPFHDAFITAAIQIDDPGAEPGLGRTAQGVLHLQQVLKTADDRELAASLATPGSFTARARLEMVEALEAFQQSRDSMRSQLAAWVMGLGLAGAFFTGGSSLVLAGLIDAMLVADKTAQDVAQWQADKQYSELVLDQLSEAHWAEPLVAELIGTIVEAGFQIASDVITEGLLAKLFDGIMVLQILAEAVQTLDEGARGR